MALLQSVRLAGEFFVFLHVQGDEVGHAEALPLVWSSDVCSSDLSVELKPPGPVTVPATGFRNSTLFK